MRIGVPTERLGANADERLVAATPATTARLVALGHDVVVQRGAGEAAGFTDEAYAEAGARPGDAGAVWASDVVVTVTAPTDAQVAAMRPGATLVGMLAPGTRPERVDALAAAGVTALSLDAVPRISRAQSLDVLSAMSNVAGYRAVIEAAEEYGGMFAGQVTAAGKTPPATVFVIGAGVAGLAAIGTAVSLGARVRAFDVRPEVAEQIESMGATFVAAPSADLQQPVSSDGYASALSDEQERLTQELYAAEAAQADVVITTALVRGTAPTTITAATVAAMRPGSVIVDLAAPGGGNCELTVPGEKVVTANGVTVLGYTDLAGRLPRHTSQLVGTNVVNLLTLMTPAKDGELVLDLDDQVVRGMTVAHAGDVLWPPPPVTVSAAPAAASVPGTASWPAAVPEGATAVPDAAAPDAQDPAAAAALAEATQRRRAQRRLGLYAVLAVLAVLAITFSPGAFVGHATVFALAVIVGYYVISNVSHSLHTPLMAQTNAISGIILVGALLQIGSSSTWVSVLAFVAATVASINIFGGFLVAHRMIAMFQKKSAQKGA